MPAVRVRVGVNIMLSLRISLVKVWPEPQLGITGLINVNDDIRRNGEK